MNEPNPPCKHSTLYNPYTCEMCLAVAAERERCAKIAESRGATFMVAQAVQGIECDCGKAIAKKIREG